MVRSCFELKGIGILLTGLAKELHKGDTGVYAFLDFGGCEGKVSGWGHVRRNGLDLGFRFTACRLDLTLTLNPTPFISSHTERCFAGEGCLIEKL